VFKNLQFHDKTILTSHSSLLSGVNPLPPPTP